MADRWNRNHSWQVRGKRDGDDRAHEHLITILDGKVGHNPNPFQPFPLGQSKRVFPALLRAHLKAIAAHPCRVEA